MNDRLEEIKKKRNEWYLVYSDYRPLREAEYDNVLMQDAEEDIDYLVSALESARTEIERQRRHRKRIIKEARVYVFSERYFSQTAAGFVMQKLKIKADRDRWEARAESAKLVIQDLMTWAPNCTARDRAKTWLEEAALGDEKSLRFPIEANSAVPPGEIHLVDRKGIKAKIINVEVKDEAPDTL